MTKIVLRKATPLKVIRVGVPGLAGPQGDPGERGLQGERGDPGPAGGAAEQMVADETISIGDILVVNSSGRVVRAVSTIASDRYRVVGVALQAATAVGQTIDVFVGQMARVAVNFGAAPPSSDNGKQVWLSSVSGRAVVTPPVSDGNAVVPVGVLQGADGFNASPDVLLNVMREVLVEV